MVSLRQLSQALCLLSTISLGQTEEVQRSKNIGYSKLYTRNFVNYALSPRQSSCDSGYQLCPDGECALATDSCCNGGGSCHAGYTCYGIGSAGGCCPNGETCSGPGVGCTGTDVECSDGCHPAGYSCNSSPTAAPSLTPTTPSGSSPTSFNSGCLSDEKTCGADFCIPSDGICCGDGYYCNPGHVCQSDGAGNYKCPLGSSSGATSSLGGFGSQSSLGFSSQSTFGFSPTSSLQISSPTTTNNFGFTFSSVAAGSTASGNPLHANAAPAIGTNVYGGLAGLLMVLLGL